MPPTTTAPPPVLPADVIAFAADHGVSDYLAPVAEMTRQVFSGAASISVVVEDDYEVPDERLHPLRDRRRRLECGADCRGAAAVDGIDLSALSGDARSSL